MLNKKNLLILLLSLVLSFAIFGNGIRGNFVFDDTFGISQRQDLKDPRNLFKLFVSPYYFQQPEIGLYRPLPMMSYLLNFILFGQSPISFKIVNILLHAFSGFLVFKLIEFLTASFKFSFFSFLLFLVHPIHTEAVTLIVGRAEILAFLFSIGMIYLHLTKKYLWANICFLAALFSKEIAVMTIPLLFYIEWTKNSPIPLRAKLIKYLFYIAPLAFYFLLRYATLGKYIFESKALNFIENPLAFISLPERIFTAFKVLYLYIEKLFYPIGLSNDYSYNVIKIVQNPLSSWESLLGNLIFVFLIFLCLYPKTRKTPLGLGAAIFLLPYLLISNFVLTIGTIMGERLIYFSSLGFVLIVSYLLIKLGSRSRQWEKAIVTFFCIIIVVLGIMTILRNEDWLNDDSLYSVNLKNHPEGFLTQLYWGTALINTDKMAEAKKHLNNAQKIYSDNPKLIITFGAIAELEGRDYDAEKYYKTALEKYDLAIEAYSKLGYLYFNQKRYEEASSNLLKAIALYPTASDVSYYARTQIELQTPEKGIEVIHKYFGYSPQDIEIVTALGYSYYLKEDYQNALEYLTRSKSLGNVNPEIDNMIAISQAMLENETQKP